MSRAELHQQVKVLAWIAVALVSATALGGYIAFIRAVRFVSW